MSIGKPLAQAEKAHGQEVDREETGEGLKANSSSQLDCPEGPHQ